MLHLQSHVSMGETVANLVVAHPPGCSQRLFPAFRPAHPLLKRFHRERERGRESFRLRLA